MKAKNLIALSVISIIGCAGVGAYQDGKLLAGVPILAGIEGSYARLNDEWVLSAAHNSILLPKNAIYHDYCDIALIKMPGKSESKAGIVHYGESVIMTGYPMASPIKEIKASVIGDTYVKGYPGCVMTVTDEYVKPGMSGGGVYNDNGELVGIIHGFTTECVKWEGGKEQCGGGIFVPLLGVSDWIYEITGVEIK